MSSPQQHQKRRRQRRSATSAVVTTAATAAVAYGTYRLAQWYWNEDEESEEGTEHPLEEDLPSFSAEEYVGGDMGNRNEDKASSKPRSGKNDENNFSWLSTAAVGVANWLIDDNNVFPGVQSGSGHRTGSTSEPKLTRRQKLIRCRYQARIAFHTCFQTAKPVIENLTDSSRQTKELKILRKRKQALKQGGQDDDVEEKKEVCNRTITMDQEQQERELRQLQLQEEELWREILVETTTKMMASSYAYTLLLLSLTVQFHWLASTEASHLNSSEDQERNREAFLMQSHRYFLNEGIPQLVSTIRRAAEKVMFGDDDDVEENAFDRTGSSSHWRNPSLQFVSSKDVEQTLYRKLPRVLDDLRMGNRRCYRRRRNWVRFVLPDEEVFDPVWDICKSPVWEDAQDQLLRHLWYKVLRDGQSCSDQADCDNIHGWGRVFQKTSKCPHLKSGYMPEPGRKHREQEGEPLAKVMVNFKRAASTLFEAPLNNEDNSSTCPEHLRYCRKTTLVERLQTISTVLELGDITFALAGSACS